MATTDTKSGFRLPWSQDRSHEDEPQPDLEVEALEPVVEDDGSSVDEEPWPEVDVNARLGLPRDERPPEATASTSSTSEEPEAMVETAQAPAAAAPLRKQSKLIADLAAAMRSTAEVAREQSLAQVEADVKQVVEGIRSRSSEGAAALRQRSDEDLAGIREWSKAEIARIREETEVRITKRKAALETELADHAAAIDRRVEDVQGMVADYENEMADFFERLLKETDPARLASMAETMPEPPSFDAWADVDDLASTASEPVDEPVEAPAAAAPEPVAEAVAEAVVAEPEPAAAPVVAEAPAPEATATPEPDVAATADPEPEAAIAGADEAPDAAPEPGKSNASWAESDEAWTGGTTTTTAVATDESTDDVPRWAAGETPDGFPTSGEGGEPVDRGAIMAALEAAAEAVVAAESAAESADQAEAAADVAETAAGLLVTRVDPEEEELDPEAAAALAARMDGFEAESSFADRLAALLPGHGSGDGGETVTTQLVVSGLVSVASIASFKRHLARIQGVQAVAVASGPDGEFVFNATHRSDVSFRDVVPSMPGFAARVTSSGDGVVHVTARDPEAEG